MSLSSLEFRHAGIARGWGYTSRAIQLLWMRYLRHRQLRRDLALLAAMDDFELRDIGLSRMEIRAAIRAGTDLGSRSC
jgi:uncharacterized protein YjiS (DUF1127 family)